MEKQFFYEMQIGGYVTIIDVVAIPQVLDAEGKILSPEVAEVSHEEYREVLDRKNVVAKNVPDAMGKIQLKNTEFISSAIRGQEIHAS